MKDNDSVFHEQEAAKLIETEQSTRQVYDGVLLKVFSDKVKLPDHTFSTREWIKHPGACAVVPVFEDGTIMLLKQFRYPPRKIFIEVPAGKIDPGEDPIRTAERELLEESGIRCKHLEKVGSFYPAIGYADEIIHSYVAWGLKIEDQNVDDDEFLEPYRISFKKALQMIENGEITDSKTISTLFQVKMWWIKNQPFAIDFKEE
ncbi:MAG: NUDIX hydrolase [Balneolaceae bacterium]